jgi:hypothetical protein
MSVGAVQPGALGISLEDSKKENVVPTERPSGSAPAVSTQLVVYENPATAIPLIAKFAIRNMTNADFADRNSRKGCRRVAQAAMVMLGCLGAVPFIPISFQFAKNNATLGVFLASGEAYGTITLGIWSLFRIVDHNLRSRTDEEEELSRLQSTRCCISTATKVVVLAMGLIATVPDAFVAYSLNGNSLLFGILQLVADPWDTVYSLKLSMDAVRSRCNQTQFDRSLLQIKKYLIEQLQSNQENINALELGESANHLLALDAICRSDQSQQEKITALLRVLFETKPEPIRKEYVVTKALRYFSGAVGGALGLARLTFAGVIGYKGTELFTDQAGVCYAAGAVVALCNTHLVMKVSTRACVRIYNFALGCLHRTQKTSLSFRIQPKLTACLWILTLAMAGLSYAPSVQACRYYLSGSFGNGMQIAVPLGFIIVSLNAASDLIGGVIRQYALKRGTPQVKQLLLLNEKIERFILLIEQSPIIEFAKCVKILPPEILGVCLNRAKITLADLNRYLGEDAVAALPLEYANQS